MIAALRPLHHNVFAAPGKHLFLSLIVLAFIALAVYYSVVTPIFEAPDEVWHYNFVREVAVNHGLPVVTPNVKQSFAHEGLQPPLYYTLGALLIAWMDPHELGSLPAPNPYALIGEPAYSTNDNRNAFLHTSAEDFPYHGAALAVHLLRLYSILLATGTVILTYLLGLELFFRPEAQNGIGPEVPRHRIALLAAAFVGFLPQFLFISGAISNDNMATMLSAAALWQLARLINRGLDWKRGLVLGLFVGAALLAKVSTVALVPLVLLVLAYLFWSSRDWLGAVRTGVVFLAVVALIAGWWYLRNQLIYGQVYPFAPLAALVGARPSPLSPWRWLSAEGEGLRLSTWGVFGWFNILSAPWFYVLYDALAAIGLAGLVYALLRGRNLSATLLVLPLWIILCIAALWDYSSMIVSTQGRLLFPALSAWAALWALGISNLAPVRFQPPLMGAIGGVMGVCALLTPGLVIAPAYSPTVIVEAQLPANLIHIDRRFENGVEWPGATVDRTNVQAGDALDVTIYERIPTPEPPGAAIFVHLVNSAGVIIAQRDSFIASGSRTTAHAPYVVADTFRVPIPVTVPAPDDWQVQIGMYDPATGKRYIASDSSGREQGNVLTLTTIAAQAAAPGEFNFDFDGRVSMIGANFERTAVAPGDVLRVTLKWGNGLAGSGPYHVFVHVLGENDHIWATADLAIDGQPSTQVELHIDPRTPPGVYPLEVGVYAAPDGDRLEVFDAHGQDLADRMFLGPIRVSP